MKSKNEHRKPTKLRNITTRNETYDTLSSKAGHDVLCSAGKCLGSVMSVPTVPSTPRPPEEVLPLAKEFIDEYYASCKRLNSAAHLARWETIQREVQQRGTYELTETELVYGAKLAWRNSPRCIGRIQWSKLQVFDARYVTTTSGMFEALCNHIKYATNRGNLRSAITIFPPRTDGKHDFRVWNPLLIAYAGYKNADGTVTGDPMSVELTEVCQKLGWKGQFGRFDVLPVVLQANGHDPEYFELPPELVLEVPIVHPDFPAVDQLGVKWFALPAVSGMMFDCGGVQFPGVPFNGWYMVTEVGARDLCDSHRYNMLETLAVAMGMDTSNPSSLWKDKALVEVNYAVLHSFQKMNVTMVDHHTASESFMKFCENEQRLRGGCPADWVWIVPPVSGSLTSVFHQEMALYHLSPSYEYQDPAWRTHVWKKDLVRDQNRSVKKTRRKFHFKEIARAVKFTSKLFGKALSRRIKATVLYATETGRSEMYAKILGEIFGHAFNAQVCRMDEYDIMNIQHEALVLVVTSTFGNGDPPENGEDFAQNLYSIKLNGETSEENTSEISNEVEHEVTKEHRSLRGSRSFMRINSQTEPVADRKVDTRDVLRSSISDVMSEENLGLLSNVRYSVFALGSSAYPNFCAFGKYVDNLLYELGGEKILKLRCGDEICGQEQAFKAWAQEIFHVACETFCLEDVMLDDATAALKADAVTADVVRLHPVQQKEDILSGLNKSHNKKVFPCKVLAVENLHGENASRHTMFIRLQTTGTNIAYKPGDHVGLFPINREELVTGILKRLANCPPWDQVIVLQVLKERHTPNGVVGTWQQHEKAPACNVWTLLSRFVDITTPPTPKVLELFASYATDDKEKERLQQLAQDLQEYEKWRYWHYPHLLEVLQEFPSVRMDAALLVSQLSPLQPRFYSISSSPSVHPSQLHLTVATVVYRTRGGEGPLHYGVCSNYLKDVAVGEDIPCFVRSAPNFHLPQDITKPVIMVGPGTGIAPFRSFWQQRCHDISEAQKEVPGKMSLFFGCRTWSLELYREEKEEMLKAGVLDKMYVALSREKGVKKTYVQDLLASVGPLVYQQVVTQRGHFFVCGDCTMAENVHQTLKQIIQTAGKMTEQEMETYMLTMRDQNRYHEDIFGITLRTAEVQDRSRESAWGRITVAS